MAVTRIQFRRGTAVEWAAENPTLNNGEPGFETDSGFLKLGDGVTAWNDLGYVSTGGTGGGGGTGGSISTVNGDPGPTVLLDMDDIPETTASKRMTAAERTKLTGVAAGATVNQPDAFLLDRSHHSGVQPISSVTNLQSTLDAKAPAGSAASAVYVWRYSGGAWPTLPSTAPVGVQLVEAFGPTQPPAAPSWVGNAVGKIPARYEWQPLT